MATPALAFEIEEPAVEERVARLEANVEHIPSDISEMKFDIRRMNDKIDAVNASVMSLTVAMERSFSKLRNWAVAFYIGLAAAIFTVMAHGFHWL